MKTTSIVGQLGQSLEELEIAMNVLMKQANSGIAGEASLLRKLMRLEELRLFKAQHKEATVRMVEIWTQLSCSNSSSEKADIDAQQFQLFKEFFEWHALVSDQISKKAIETRYSA